MYDEGLAESNRSGLGKVAAMSAHWRAVSWSAVVLKFFSPPTLHAVESVAGLDRVQIHLHDALLAPQSLYKHSEISLEAFSHPR